MIMQNLLIEIQYRGVGAISISILLLGTSFCSSILLRYVNVILIICHWNNKLFHLAIHSSLVLILTSF